MLPSQQPQSEGQTKRLRLPNELTTAQSKLVYLALAQEGDHTVRQLSNRLQLGASEIYPVLRVLRDEGLVVQRGECYTLEEP
ncbi:helix-turn-helix domain-containing protein [Haloarchaeobius salinus]|uniref:helix-turn-helix domain-containing protein n=1 Tax=Haloarchaeobius salinus TaxID=1198298 RepID=UPI00210CB4E5|nr:winged helix-turn-helix domain-containing protein [Haloarchaeobius salinus]